MSAKTEMNDSSTMMVYGGAVATFVAAVPKTPVNRELRDTDVLKMASWGLNNDLPQLIITELKRNQDLGSLLDLQARIMYAGGVDYELMDPETYEPLENQVDKDIEAFLKRNWMYPIQACQDFYRFFNVFPEMILTENRDKIKWLIGRKANECRYASQNSSGKIPKCYINSNWPSANPEDKETLKYPVLDPVMDQPEALRKRKDGVNYIYGLSFPTGETYYSIPNWWALKSSKWLELANKIPAFKLAMMNNQISLKYHIQFPDYYWEWRYPTWKKMSEGEKTEKKQKEIKTIVDMLQGEENSGKTLVTGYKFDEHHNKEYPGIKVEPIDDKIKDGIYLEDSVEATIKIFTALGVDPTILGIVPSKGGSSLGGSNKREALNIYISIIQTHIDLVLRPYDFISDYNGWNNDKQIVRWHFKAPLLQTLDQVTPKDRETVPQESKSKL